MSNWLWMALLMCMLHAWLGVFSGCIHHPEWPQCHTNWAKVERFKQQQLAAYEHERTHAR
jgi:hypothetical protein